MTPFSSYTRSGTGRPAEEFTASATLRGYLAHAKERAARIDPRFERLWGEIERMAVGGKGLRPQLVERTALCYPARPTRPVINAVGAAFELLHTGLIIHDDVIDQDELRRHGPTVNAAATRHAARRIAKVGAASSAAAREHALQYGRSAAVIAGDLALTGAYRLIATSRAPESRLLKLLGLLDDAVFQSAAGELLDIDHALPGNRVPDRQVLETTRLKTAAYSFEAPLKAGAVLGGAPAADVTLLGEIGRAMGTAYQLVDDLLGVFGDPRETGKSVVSDLREGKRTMLLCLAEQGPYGSRVRAIMDRAAIEGLDDQDAHAARDLLRRSGAKEGVERMVEGSVRDAEDLLTGSTLPPGLIEWLTETLAAITRRSR